MSMHNPVLYDKYRSFQVGDAKKILQTFKNEVKDERISSVIDLGCGDGFITCTILKPALPSSFKEIIGVDVSEEMIKHAAEVYSDDKIKFKRMNIVGDIPEDFKGRFDLVFSNSVFQFLADQERAFRNVYKLLSEGGKCVISSFACVPMSKVFHDLVSKDKWHDVKQNIENVFIELFMTEEPENVIKGIVQKIGFKDCVVRREESFHDYESFDSLKKMIESGNFARLEGNRLKEFLEEYIEIFKNISTVERLSETTDAFRLHYYRLIVFGRK